MDEFDTLRARIARNIAAENARLQAIEHLDYCAKSLRAGGFRPDLTMDSDGIVLRVDIQAQPRGAPTVIAATQPPPVPIEKAGTAEVAAGAVPGDRTAPGQAPALVPHRPTGEWTQAECNTALRMDAEGKSARDIANVLGRRAQGIAAKVKFLRRQKEKAKVAAKAAAGREDLTRSIQDHLASTPQTPAPVQRQPERGRPAKQAEERTGDERFYINLPELNEGERCAELRLRHVGYRDGWTPERDLQLVEGLASGRKLLTIAADLGVTRDAARMRWENLLPSPGLDAQEKLLGVLRKRAEAAR